MNNLFKLLFVAVLCIATNSSFAQYAEIDGISYYTGTHGVNYNYNSGKPYAKIAKPSRGMPEYSGNLVIPDSITEKEENGNERVLPVCSVQSNAFAGCKKLHSVVLPNSIKRIGEKAFAGCTELTYVYFPKTAKLEEHVFENCPNLVIRPHDMTINVAISVIDTLEAEKIIATKIKRGQDKLELCKELLSAEMKSTKDEEDLKVLDQAYKYFLIKQYGMNYETTEIKHTKVLYKEIIVLINPQKGRRLIVDDVNKDVRKGKLTSEVREYLSSYAQFLTDSLQNEKIKFEKDGIPYKNVSSTKVNPFYRGRRYQHADELDNFDTIQQKQGWEFLYTDKREECYESYPNQVSYLVYDAAPDYRVTYYEENNNIKIKKVYDNHGKLVYVPSLTRKDNKSELEDVRRLVYFKDYYNNKYDIHKQSENTQEYIKRRLCRANGFEETKIEYMATVLAAGIVGSLALEMGAYKEASEVRTNITKHIIESYSKDGKNYIDQLEIDHANEFGYVYMIERLTNVSFRVVFIDYKTLNPSHCAVITYRTGKEPYTTEFSTKLVAMPKDILPVIKD